MQEDRRLISWEEIQTLLHNNAEKGFIHTTYQEESQRFHYLMNGDPRAIEDSMHLMNPDIQGKLSQDPVRNIRYLYVINIGLATRYMIEAGIPQETVYSTSDLYIQKADLAQTVAEIQELNREVWTVFVETVKAHKKESMYSKPILFCLNYIDSHFNEKITLESIAEQINLSPCYLATLFKKETGETLTEYINKKRISHAKHLLRNTNLQIQTIAQHCGILDLHYFCRMFKKYTDKTPTQYRENVR